MRSNLIIAAVVTLGGIAATPTLGSAPAEQWQTPAKWHRAFKKAEPGILVLDGDGIEFRSGKFSQRWKYIEIHTFDLSQRQLTFLTYQNRYWHEPGERPFRFTLGAAMPPDIAAQLAQVVGKPALTFQQHREDSMIGRMRRCTDESFQSQRLPLLFERESAGRRCTRAARCLARRRNTE